ncbi:hypothetical protein TNCV_1066701 [Trichonephila clavipes]|uniref:Uncharacterized protein n=1 Tax=Trichonephila clavipes TaxID=2585209 RepID=A0A8X6RA14_TRICX|nr:hypothetical protein TNCV_1066701 [Trichonephila clavipes]
MMPSSFYEQAWGLSRAGRMTLGTKEYATKPNELTSNFFRTSDCIENDTTMEDDSFRQESQVNTSKEPFFFLNLTLISLAVLKVFLTVLINNVWNIKNTSNGRSKILLDILREFILNFGMKTNYLKSLTKKAKNY